MKTLYAWSLSKTRQPYDAEELCSETIVAVMSSAPKLRNDDAFFGFLWQTAANTYKVYMRKNKRHTYTELDEEVSDDADFVNDICNTEQANLLRRELSLLSEEYRNCTVAFYYDKLSCAEIAKKYGISVEMVKYYLFKARKILKEGIAMERQFGEKSFKPSEVYFNTSFIGMSNKEYSSLFRRKLPGQILLSAYYEPMDVLQLSVELGVASVYLEEELKLLMEYKLLKKVGTKKYQTDVLVISKEFSTVLYEKLDSEYAAAIAEIIGDLREKLPAIRKIGFAGNHLKENLLLWDVFAWVSLQAAAVVQKPAWDLSEWKVLYGNTTGINYISERNTEKDYSALCVGNGMYVDGYQFKFIGFGALKDSVNNFLTEDAKIKDESGAHFPSLNMIQRAALEKVLKAETERMSRLLAKISKMSVELLLEYSPTGMREKVKAIYPQVNLTAIAGWYGAAAVNTNALQQPDKGEYAGIIGYKQGACLRSAKRLFFSIKFTKPKQPHKSDKSVSA